MTLTFGLVFRKIMSRAYLLYYYRKESQIWWVDPTLDGGVSHTIFGHFDLASDLVCRIIVSRTYLLYYMRWESQICCIDTSLDADVSHTILGHCDLDL